MIKQSSNIQSLFCPNIKCQYHSFEVRPKRACFFKHGCYFSKARKRLIERFQCKSCRTTFSRLVNSIEFRNHRLGINSRIFRGFCKGQSNHEIGRSLKIAESVVRFRLLKLAKHALIAHTQRTLALKIAEPISYDGVENFANSQYEPNYINQAIGMKSYFVYDFNFSPLNRKGRMSDRQRLKKESLEKSLGRFSKDAVQASTEVLFTRLNSMKDPKFGLLCIASDEHYQYIRARHRLKERGIVFDHKTISAKAPRVFRHILFPVNHADLLLRQHIKAFARETISFSKTHQAMVQKYALFMSWKNYFRPQFTKKQKTNPLSNIQTPAMAIGLETKVLNFRDFFGIRMLPTQVALNNEWLSYHDSKNPAERFAI